MPQPFIDISFPNTVARGATGGPGFMTTIVPLASSAEQRNSLWANARCKFDISTGIRTREQMLDVIALFRVVRGRAYSFRFKDWNDYDAADQAMQATSDDKVWQLVKRYSIGGHEHVRTITKPVSGTVSIKDGASPVTPSDIDYTTGKVTFSAAPNAPTASFEFDVPVRFDSDDLPVQANAWDQQIVQQIDLVEVPE